LPAAVVAAYFSSDEQVCQQCGWRLTETERAKSVKLDRSAVSCMTKVQKTGDHSDGSGRTHRRVILCPAVLAAGAG